MSNGHQDNKIRALKFNFWRTMSKPVSKWIVPYVIPEENKHLSSYCQNTAKNLRKSNPKLGQTKKYLSNQFGILTKSITY